MQLRIRLFFALYKEGQRREAIIYREHLRIAVVPKMTLEYYDLLNEAYEMAIDPEKKKLPPRPNGPCIQMGTLEARHVLQSVMQNVKRNRGFA